MEIARQAGAENEVSPAMVKAGCRALDDALWRHCVSNDSGIGPYSRERIVRDVFQAMTLVSSDSVNA